MVGSTGWEQGAGSTEQGAASTDLAGKQPKAVRSRHERVRLRCCRGSKRLYERQQHFALIFQLREYLRPFDVL